MNYRGSIGDFSYNVGTTFSYAKNKVVYVSEAPAYPYQAQTGHRIGTKLGLKCVGFYQQEDFDENEDYVKYIVDKLNNKNNKSKKRNILDEDKKQNNIFDKIFKDRKNKKAKK